MQTLINNKLSVCLLSYNHGSIIKQAIESVLNQTYKSFEFIISDDCSEDDSWQVISRIAERDCRVIPIRTPKNLGMAGNANFAISFAKNDYIALLHHDDICDPTLLARWVDVLDRNPDISFVFNQYMHHESGFIFDVSGLVENNYGREFFVKHLLSSWGCPVRGTALIRRTDFYKVGCMDERFNLLADIDLWMRLAMYSNVGYVRNPLLRVRHQRPDNYPEEYLDEVWSWKRLKLLYEIHAENTRRYIKSKRLGGAFLWARFRLRLNLETSKWLSYALVRGRKDMLINCMYSTTKYDYFWLSLYRYIILKYYDCKK